MSNLACNCVLPCGSRLGTSAPVALEGAGTAEVLPSLLPRGVSGQCGCDEGCVDPNAKPVLQPRGTLPSLIFPAHRGLPSLLILPSHPPSLPPSLASSRDGQRDAKDFDGQCPECHKVMGTRPHQLGGRRCLSWSREQMPDQCPTCHQFWAGRRGGPRHQPGSDTCRLFAATTDSSLAADTLPAAATAFPEDAVTADSDSVLGTHA
jgi:hypothetical protein